VFSEGGKILGISVRRARAAEEILCHPDVVTTAKFGASDKQTGSKRSSERPAVRPRLSNPVGDASAQHFEYILVQNRTIRHRSLCQYRGINAAATS
jgi:hypothetical protein